MLEIVRLAADRIGGVPRLAERLGVTRQAIYQWREVPVDRLADMAAATGLARADLRPDLYTLSDAEVVTRLDHLAHAAAPAIEALRQDRHLWLQAQAHALAAGDWSAIDLAELGRLLDGLYRDAEADVLRRLRVIMSRLLKWQFRPLHRSMSTIGVVTAERARLLQRFGSAPSLRTTAADALPTLYEEALADIVDETTLARDAFPADCPFSLDELLDPHFAPSARSA